MEERSSFSIPADKIADWFIAYTNSDENDDLITNARLQAFLYYAQEMCVLHTDKNLFDEPMLPLEHGVAVGNVYHQYSSYGKSPIELNIKLPKFDEEIESILKDVCVKYGQYSTWKLIEMIDDEIFVGMSMSEI